MMDKSGIMRQAAILSANSEVLMKREREMFETAERMAEMAAPQNKFYELVASGMSSREAKRKLAKMAKRKKK